jgi:tetratricopeptide (TPR) repeat protein
MPLDPSFRDLIHRVRARDEQAAVTGPAKLRAPDHALHLACRATAITPSNAIYGNTRGVVLYRLGDFETAIATLQKSMRDDRKGEQTGYNLFFLAMSHQRLGDCGKARDCYDQALRWWQAQGTLISYQDVEELNAFRVETDALLKDCKP